MTSTLDTPLAGPAKASPRTAPLDLPRLMLAVWSSPLLAGLSAAAVYTLIAVLFGPHRLGQSGHPYFVYLADALLHGQFALTAVPPSTRDLTLYQGQYYLYWPPFPAVPFLPLVAVFGLGVSDIVVTLLVAGLNIGLVSLLLRELDVRHVVSLTPEKRAWLTAFFAFGTVHVTLAPYGRVWPTGQLVAFAMLCAAYLTALRLPRRWAPVVAGVLVGAAFLSRNSTLFAAGWIAWYLWSTRDRSDRFALVRIAAAGLAPVMVAVALQGGYNYLRFGNPLEHGLAYHLMSGHFQDDYQRYGLFSLHYLPMNLYFSFVGFPYLSLVGLQPATDLWMGGSIFLMSPVFFLALWGTRSWWRSHGWALAASFVAGLVPALFLMGTGWIEFGPRYTLDATVPLLVATAMGVSLVPTRLVARLSMVSFAVYLVGAAMLSSVAL